jgi:glycosyltransferase involved in cell wall biosynthesis
MTPRPLCILQTCFSRSWGGLEIQALEMAVQIQKRGHTVLLACLPGSSLAREAQRSAVETWIADIRGYVHPFLVLRLSRTLRKRNVDLIHCQLSKDIASVVPAMRLSGSRIPVLLSKRVGSSLSKKDFFHRLTYSQVSRVLAISEVIHRNVIDTTPVPPERVITLHDALDTTRFSPGRADRRTVRRAFGIRDDEVLVGFVGRFSPGKGHEELIEAADILRHDNKRFRVLIVGGASYGEEAYERKIREMSTVRGLDTLVTFAGFRDDIPDVMASFDILAFPSHAESFGVVLIEGMAMEKPAVATNCDGVLDIVVDGVTGILVPPRNAARLAAGIGNLIDDPVLRERMGKAGRQRVLELFDQRKQIDRLEEIYRSLIAEVERSHNSRPR